MLPAPLFFGPFLFMVNYRKIWEDANGAIPKDELGRSYEIHHIDGNRENNDLNNLKCVSIEEHYQIHYQQKDYASCSLILAKMSFGTERFFGWNHTEETKRKMSESKKGKPSWNKGKACADETRRKISETKNTIKNGMYGKKHSEETIKKMSEVKKGKKNSEETRIKISNSNNGRISPNTGKSFSEEHKAKLSESMKGKTWTEARRLAQKQIKNKN